MSNAKDIIEQAQNRMYRHQTAYSGLSKTMGGRDAQNKYFKFISDITEDIDAFEATNKRPPNYKEQREMVTNRLFPNGIQQPQQPGKPGGPNQAQASTAGGGAPAQPNEDTARYEDILKKNGYPVTPKNIKWLQDQETKKAQAKKE